MLVLLLMMTLFRIARDGPSGTRSVYNIDGICERNNLQAIETICTIVDRLCPALIHAPCSSLITFVEDRPGHDQRYAMDCTKIQCELGWQLLESFASGLTRTVQWYVQNFPWVARVQSGTYQRERLGLSVTERVSL